MTPNTLSYSFMRPQARSSSVGLVAPETKIKVLWYLLFSVIGVFHAEVLSWSSPTVLYNPSNFLLVTPVYAVHYILFGDLIVRHRRSGFKALYVFGCLTGMYETFITKVYWSPPWNPAAAGPLGVAWLELLWIGFTWHAFMSFLIPLRLMDGLFSPVRSMPFEKRNMRMILWVTPTLGAITGYGFGISVEVMLTSVLLSLLVIILLSVAFLAGSRRWGFVRPQQLTFGRKGRWLALGSFASVYIGYGVLLRPELFPLGLPLIPVLLIYGGLIYLGAVLLRSPPGVEPPVISPTTASPRASLSYLLLYALTYVILFLAFGGLNSLVPQLLPAAVTVLIFAGAGLPVLLLPLVAIRTFRLRGRKLGVADHL